MESIVDISETKVTEKKLSSQDDELPEQHTSFATIKAQDLPAMQPDTNSDGSRNSKPVVNWPDKTNQKKSSEAKVEKQEEEGRPSCDEGKVEEAFQDVFHLFERGEKLILDGKVLVATMEEYEIHLTDTEIDSILSILDNHGHMMDILEFCYLVLRAKNHILKIKKGIKPKAILSALREFLVKSATACISKRDTFSRTSADTLKFYFKSARLTGITENQVAKLACSIDTTGHSPYKAPLVLPGLPPDSHMSEKRKIVLKTPCTIIPPHPSAVGGKRLSKCTILPYDAAGLENTIQNIEAKVLHPQHINRPRQVDPLPKLGTRSKQEKVLHSQHRNRPSKVDPLPKLATRTKQKAKVSISHVRGKPRLFKLPQIAKYDGREITFEESAMIRDEIKLAQRDYHEKERIKEEKKILHSIPSDRLKWTIKAYIG